ncbi:hypothetical protein BH09ACT4_BH09ACT4_06390 [soil metagenome]
MTAITFNTALALGPATSPRLRLTSRGRAVFGTLAAIPVVAIAIFLGLGAGGAHASDELSTGTFEYVSIAPGESMWQLAEQIAPLADPREVVADILSLNNLSSGDVQPGQELAIPSEYTGQ